jgi:hypothetical protein
MKTGFVIIAVAIIWAAVILATSMTLEGTAQESSVLRVLGGGAAGTIIILGGALNKVRKQNG